MQADLDRVAPYEEVHSASIGEQQIERELLVALVERRRVVGQPRSARPGGLAAGCGLVGRARGPHVKVIVVDAPRVGLRHHLAGPPQGLDGVAAREPPLEEPRLHDVAHEDPLDACVGILEQGLGEEPLALDVEPEPAGVRLVARQAIGAEVDEAGALHRDAVEGGDVKEQVRVDARAMREVRRQGPPSGPDRQVADAQGAARALARDGGGRALDRLGEPGQRPVTVVLPEPAEPHRVPAGPRCRPGGRRGSARRWNRSRRGRAATGSARRRRKPARRARAHGDGPGAMRAAPPTDYQLAASLTTSRERRRSARWTHASTRARPPFRPTRCRTCRRRSRTTTSSRAIGRSARA